MPVQSSTLELANIIQFVCDRYDTKYAKKYKDIIFSRADIIHLPCQYWVPELAY